MGSGRPVWLKCLCKRMEPESTAFKVLEANNPVFDEPTLAVLSGDTLFYIANSQWAAIDEKGKLAGDDKLARSHCC